MHKRIGHLAGLALAAGLILSSAASAQEAGAAPAEPTSADLQGPDHVVITGRPVEEVAREFVGALAVAPRGENQMGRWDRSICPGVVGMTDRYSQPILDRIAARAMQVGLTVGEPGCKANILVILTDNPDYIAKSLVEEHREALGWFPRTGQRTLGRRELKKFIQSDAPVRWWHVSQTMTRDGMGAGESGQPGADYSVVYVPGGASRLSRATRQDFSSAIIIVDARALKGFTYGALADYLAMVALAQLDAEADTSDYSTVLNLFAERPNGAAAPAGMTEWDLAYLQGVYDMKRDARTANAQQRSITRSVVGDLSQD